MSALPYFVEGLTWRCISGCLSRPARSISWSEDVSRPVARVELSADRGRPSEQVERQQLEARLDDAVRGAMVDAADALGTDVFGIALASFVALLFRHTQQAELALGVWNGDATPARLLRCEMADDATFVELVTQVRDRLVSAEPLGPSDIRSVNVLFGMRHAGRGQLATGAADLALTLEERPQGIDLRFEYDGRLFRGERMRDLLDQYRGLVDQAARSPALGLYEYSLVTEGGRTVLPDPRQPLDTPHHAPLTEVFLRCAEQGPSEIAVRQGGRAFTYAELAQASQAIALELRRRGVADGDVVAVTGRRSFAVVSSMLGVLRSGGVLLTLDPKLPLERRKVMLHQAAAKVLILVGDADTAELANTGLELIEIDPASAAVRGSHPGPGDLPAVQPEWPAYVFFTSGSTGVPKAVRGRHHGLAHFLAWQRSTFGIGRGDRASQLTALSFDVVMRDMFLALTSGATLCIPDEGDVLDPPRLLRWLEDEGVTVVHVVPSLARVWLNHVPEGVRLPKLRRVFFAGEPLTDVLVGRFREVFGQSSTIINLYGPTETTLAKCFHVVTPEAEAGVQPIGRPLPQTQVLILNRRHQQCGIAEVGEIAIRTPFRTLGYLNAPEANARAFVPNPFGNDPDDLVYLTGDSGRYRTDGLLDILGRIDNQVKIRGVRIEPGEIEATLGHHPNVRETVIVAREDGTGTKMLVAYVVPKTPDASTAKAIADLRDYLRTRLSEQMVPSAFVLLDALPLNANGKVDKKALPPPDHAAMTGTEYAAPTTDLERELAGIWKELLGVEQVGIHDSFLELGGDSLTAINALMRMRKLGLSDDLARGVFQGKTIAELARDKESGTTVVAPMRDEAKTTLVVNMLRGLLVATVVTDHWAVGFLNRLPENLRGVEHTFVPLFNAATPGFAFVFGMGLGYTHYSNYKVSPARVWKTFRFGAELIGLAILLSSAFSVAAGATKGAEVTLDSLFISLFSPLLFYLSAISTAGLWFGFISRLRRELLACAILGVGSYATFRVASWILIPHEQTGFLQLCRLMLVAKFNYFNMSIPVLGGLAAGIHMRRESANPRLAQQLLTAGACAAGIGLAVLRLGTGGFDELRDPDNTDLWRWAFYAGGVLVVGGILRAALVRYDRLPGGVRTTFHLAGVLGQCALPVFVLHGVVLNGKALLKAFGLPEKVALMVPLAIFFSTIAWMMTRIYRLYYGTTSYRRG